MKRQALPVVYLLLAAVLVIGRAPAAGAQSEPAAAPGSEPQAAAPSVLRLANVEITPAEPGVDTLCQLRVSITNAGELPASSLAFTVALSGQPLKVYTNQLFMPRLDPGTTTELRLYNFWTTESGRSAPADGRLTVEVALTEASWMEITTDEEGVETWKPAGPVPGLPVSAGRTLVLKK